jgi:hypothetical protein
MDYRKTIIYKIVCLDLSIKNCYVGHTTSFRDRRNSHHSAYKLKPDRYVYQFIRENGGWDNWDMIMIENYPCNNKIEAGSRERHWIETLNADLNQLRPPTGLTNAEYIKEYMSEYQTQYKSQYKTDNADKIKEQNRIYRETNREAIRLRNKTYVDANKDKINERKSKKVCCVLCRKQLRWDNLNGHYKRLH